MYFDTHAHYDDHHFDIDREAVLSSLPGSGIALVLNPGCDVNSSRAAAQLAERFSHVYAAAGIHPEDCAGAGEEDYVTILELCKLKKTVAVGEIGLDYHWPENPPKEVQREVLRKQLDMAMRLDLPVIIHDRDAHADCFAIVSEYPALRGVFHCYSGSPEMAKALLMRGWYLGFDGPVTYKNAKRALEVLKITPPDRILLETDSPYLPPVPHRGKRNDSRFLPYIARVVADAKGISAEEVARLTMENGKRLFQIN